MSTTKVIYVLDEIFIRRTYRTAFLRRERASLSPVRPQNPLGFTTEWSGLPELPTAHPYDADRVILGSEEDYFRVEVLNTAREYAADGSKVTIGVSLVVEAGPEGQPENDLHVVWPQVGQRLVAIGFAEFPERELIALPE